MKYAVVIAAMTGLINFSVAVPPACLLAALGQQSDPAGIETLCGDFASAMLGNLTKICQTNDLRPAYDAYASTCSEIGSKVIGLPSASSFSATATSTPSPSGSTDPDMTLTPSSPVSTGDNPQESKPSAAGAIAPHAFRFTILGLSAVGFVSVVFL